MSRTLNGYDLSELCIGLGDMGMGSGQLREKNQIGQLHCSTNPNSSGGKKEE